TPAGNLNTSFATTEPTSSSPILTAMPTSDQIPVTPTSSITAVSPTSSSASVNEISATDSAAVPTSNSTSNVVPVTAPHKLSNLRTDVQQQLQWTAAGGAAGGISSICPNHPGIDDLTNEIVREPIDQRLVVGAPPLQKFSGESNKPPADSTVSFVI